jgi:hypothetical protein
MDIKKSLIYSAGGLISVIVVLKVAQSVKTTPAPASDAGGVIATQAPVVASGAFDTGTSAGASNVVDFASVLKAQVEQAVQNASTAKNAISSTTNTDLMQRFFANSKSFIGKQTHINYDPITGAITGFDITNKIKDLTPKELAKQSADVVANLQAGATNSIKAVTNVTGLKNKAQLAKDKADALVLTTQKTISDFSKLVKPTSAQTKAYNQAVNNLPAYMSNATSATFNLNTLTNEINQFLTLKPAGVGA